MRDQQIELDDRYGKYAGKHIKPLITADRIQSRVQELADQISVDYQGSIPIIIGVLNGSFVFLSDLFRDMDLEAEVDFIKISSYLHDTRSSGTVRLLKDISCDVTGRDVLIVEDIIDSGLSIKFVKRRLEESETRSVKIATLLMKKCADVDFTIDYVGFEIPNKYVVGYGLDLSQKLRNLRSIYYLQD